MIGLKHVKIIFYMIQISGLFCEINACCLFNWNSKLHKRRVKLSYLDLKLNF